MACATRLGRMSRTGSRIRNFNFPKPVVCWACPQSKAARCKDGVRIAVRRLNIPLPHFYKLAVVFASARLRWPTEIIPPDSEALADRSSLSYSSECYEEAGECA